MTEINRNRFCAEIDLLQRLHADLKAIATGNGPTEAELVTAPMISFYDVTTRSLPCLAGLIEGKSLEASDSSGASLLVLYSPTQRWARTRSGYYRLGTQADAK